MKSIPLRLAATVILIASLGQAVWAEDQAEAVSTSPEITLEIYKSRQCGCCGMWVSHVEESGLIANSHNLDYVELNILKNQFSISPDYQSCHTAVFNGKYVFEGHVPANLIKKFLSEKPEGAMGLAVPGMPVGSPGMEMGEKFSPYDVILLKENGAHEVYAHIEHYQQQF
jgi:hypothetical protein